MTPAPAQPIQPTGLSPGIFQNWAVEDPPSLYFPWPLPLGRCSREEGLVSRGLSYPREPDSAQITSASHITTCPSCHFLPPHTTNMQCPHGPIAHCQDSPSQPSSTSWTRIPPPRAREEGSPGGALQGRRWAENLQQQWKTITVYLILLPQAAILSRVRGPAPAPWTSSWGHPHKGFGDTIRLRCQEASPQRMPSSPPGSCSAWREHPQNSPPEAGSWGGLSWPCQSRVEVRISTDRTCEVGGASGVPAHLHLRLPDHLGMPSETKI